MPCNAPPRLIPRLQAGRLSSCLPARPSFRPCVPPPSSLSLSCRTSVALPSLSPSPFLSPPPSLSSSLARLMLTHFLSSSLPSSLLLARQLASTLGERQALLHSVLPLAASSRFHTLPASPMVKDASSSPFSSPLTSIRGHQPECLIGCSQLPVPSSRPPLLLLSPSSPPPPLSPSGWVLLASFRSLFTVSARPSSVLTLPPSSRSSLTRSSLTARPPAARRGPPPLLTWRAWTPPPCSLRASPPPLDEPCAAQPDDRLACVLLLREAVRGHGSSSAASDAVESVMEDLLPAVFLAR